jgi:hypothetical protein
LFKLSLCELDCEHRQAVFNMISHVFAHNKRTPIRIVRKLALKLHNTEDDDANTGNRQQNNSKNNIILDTLCSRMIRLALYVKPAALTLTEAENRAFENGFGRQFRSVCVVTGQCYNALNACTVLGCNAHKLFLHIQRCIKNTLAAESKHHGLATVAAEELATPSVESVAPAVQNGEKVVKLSDGLFIAKINMFFEEDEKKEKQTRLEQMAKDEEARKQRLQSMKSKPSRATKLQAASAKAAKQQQQEPAAPAPQPEIQQPKPEDAEAVESKYVYVVNGHIPYMLQAFQTPTTTDSSATAEAENPTTSTPSPVLPSPNSNKSSRRTIITPAVSIKKESSPQKPEKQPVEPVSTGIDYIQFHALIVEWNALELSWDQFQNEVIGDRDPKKAYQSYPQSIRALIYRDYTKGVEMSIDDDNDDTTQGLAGPLRHPDCILGGDNSFELKMVPTVFDNGVHASKSALQALATKILLLNYIDGSSSSSASLLLYTDTLASRLLRARIPVSTITYWLTNPLVSEPARVETDETALILAPTVQTAVVADQRISSIKRPLFEWLRNMGTEDCIEFLQNLYFADNNSNNYNGHK